jgi:phospholipid transport system substrate-binding protein
MGAGKVRARYWARVWGLMCGGILTVLPLGAGAVQSPQTVIQTAVEQAMAVLKDPAYQGSEQFHTRIKKLEGIVLPHVDAWEFGRRCLGIHWQRLTDDQRQEFIDLFKALVEKSYGGMLDSYPKQDVRFSYDAERIEGDFAEVDTRVFNPTQEKPFVVMYRLHRVNEKWLIYDVVVENVSMVSNYRNQFNRIISRSSYEGLVEAIKQKLVELETAPAS